MRRLLRGFPPAFRGIAHLIQSERHARFHLLATVTALSAGAWLKVSRQDWLWLTIAIVAVWSAEALNSAIERLANRITREQDPLIGQAKDVGAAAVLIAALGATIIGTVVLWPYIQGR